MTRSYYRIILGRGNTHAAEAFVGGFIGADYGIREDLTPRLSDNARAFIAEVGPIYKAKFPDKTKIAIGLACGALWTVAYGIKEGDIVLSPDGSGAYRVGVVSGGYQFAQDGVLPHRRAVRWSETSIAKSNMTDALQRSCGSIMTVADISSYGEEIETRLAGQQTPPSDDLGVSTSAVSHSFALESHLEDFLVKNWANTELGANYDLYEFDGKVAGKQFGVDNGRGRIDILAVSKDKKTLLVVELKRGRASDVVVGQVLRYMGCIQEEEREDGQEVRGVIIASEDDPKIRQALRMVQNVDFYRYEVSFKLLKNNAELDA